MTARDRAQDKRIIDSPYESGRKLHRKVCITERMMLLAYMVVLTGLFALYAWGRNG